MLYKNIVLYRVVYKSYGMLLFRLGYYESTFLLESVYFLIVKFGSERLIIVWWYVSVHVEWSTCVL